MPVSGKYLTIMQKYFRAGEKMHGTQKITVIKCIRGESIQNI